MPKLPTSLQCRCGDVAGCYRCCDLRRWARRSGDSNCTGAVGAQLAKRMSGFVFWIWSRSFGYKWLARHCCPRLRVRVAKSGTRRIKLCSSALPTAHSARVTRNHLGSSNQDLSSVDTVGINLRLMFSVEQKIDTASPRSGRCFAKAVHLSEPDSRRGAKERRTKQTFTGLIYVPQKRCCGTMCIYTKAD